MELEAQSLGLTAGEQARLSALLRAVKDALAEAEQIIQQGAGEEQEVK